MRRNPICNKLSVYNSKFYFVALLEPALFKWKLHQQKCIMPQILQGKSNVCQQSLWNLPGNMDIGSAGIYFALALFFLWLYQVLERKSLRLPPGPIRLPLLGNILQLQQADSKYPYRATYKLSKIYGDVVYLQMGAVRSVVLHGYETLKTAMSNENFMNRVDFDWFLHRTFGKQIGLIASRREQWRPTRRFVMHQLRDFGFGKKQFQQQFIEREMVDLCNILDEAIEDNQGIIEPRNHFRVPSINIAWASAAAGRFDHKDPKILKLVNLMADWTRNAKFLEGAAAAFPVLVKWFPKAFDIQKLEAIDDEMQVFLKSLVDEIKDRGTYKTDPDSFIESYLQKLDSSKDSISVEDRTVFCEENLIAILYDLFLAGSDSTSNSMAFALMWLTMYPEVQHRLREELEQVAGKSRMATLDDKANLPYARAVILELHRRCHLFPFMPRKVYKDTPIGDYVIPANTTTLFNLYSVLMDETFWGDPQNFRPSRFLDNDNNIIHAERVINFALGKRNCIGEVIAETTIFAFITQLVQRYDLLPAYSGQVFDPEPVMGIVAAPKPFKIRVRRRE